MGYPDGIEILSIPINSNNVYFGFSKNRHFENISQKFNEKIKELRENGIIEKLIQEGIASVAGNYKECA